MKTHGGAMTESAFELYEALKQIVEELDGSSRPYSADSYLPEHMVHRAIMAVRHAEGQA
jgi:hypothetical protein